MEFFKIPSKTNCGVHTTEMPLPAKMQTGLWLKAKA
jgi:hypothetical protein